MKKVYLVKKDVNKKTSSDNWIQMNGYEFYLFMQTPEGRKRCASFGRLDGCDEDDTIIIAECGPDIAEKWKEERDAAYYRRKVQDEVGYTTFSYSQASFLDGEIISEDWIQDAGPSVEDQVIKNLEYEALHQAIQALSETEKTLIEKLFFNGGATENEAGILLGMSRGKIRYTKCKALQKLRTALTELNDTEDNDRILDIQPGRGKTVDDNIFRQKTRRGVCGQ